MTNAIKLSEPMIKYYTALLKTKGELGVYKNSIATGIRSINVNDNPDIELLNISDAFYLLYKRTGEEHYSKLGRILKKSAHVVYRQLFKINKNKPKCNRFLNVVK